VPEQITLGFSLRVSLVLIGAPERKVAGSTLPRVINLFFSGLHSGSRALFNAEFNGWPIHETIIFCYA
jgi:hypothetical protein